MPKSCFKTLLVSSSIDHLRIAVSFMPQETGFFCNWGGSWDTDYGRFFMGWYSGALLDHGDRLLTAAGGVHMPGTTET